MLNNLELKTKLMTHPYAIQRGYKNIRVDFDFDSGTGWVTCDEDFSLLCEPENDVYIFTTSQRFATDMVLLQPEDFDGLHMFWENIDDMVAKSKVHDFLLVLKDLFYTNGNSGDLKEILWGLSDVVSINYDIEESWTLPC